jgi:DUF4097 and DUF4098 domain-containing protein YvlB
MISVRHVVPLLGTCLMLLSTASRADFQRKSLGADPHGQVDIVNVSGTVEVRGWNKAEVEVTVDLTPAQRLEFSNDGGRRTVIRVTTPSGNKSRGSTDLVVQVPEGSSISINSVSADQKIRDVRGSQRLQSVSGTVETAVWSDDLQIKTISGDVRVDGHGSPNVADIGTVSGSVVLRDISGELEVETVSGDVQVRMGELTRGRVRTTNGTVDWRSTLARDARLDAEAINGDLRFRLQKPVDAEFDLETFNGEIDNCFGPKAKRTHEHGPGRSVHFVQGKGGARVGIKTMNGGVEVCDD